MAAREEDALSTKSRVVVEEEEVWAMRKVELHAHLSGSIAQEFLRAKDASFEAVDVVSARSLAQCFQYFVAVKKVITDLDGLREAARHVFEAYAAEHCVYLELRTTPKRFSDDDEDEFAYVRTVREVAADFADRMDVKLLLSLDRGAVDSLATAKRGVALLGNIAAEFPGFVVGLDVCGDPRRKSALFILEALRGVALPVTFHCAEIEDDDEVRAVVESVRDGSIQIKRFGHACYLPPDCRARLPEDFGIELCPTSNLVAMRLRDLNDHHFPRFFNNGFRVSVNCDDRGLFNCSLTSELVSLARAFDLELPDLRNLQRSALASSFHPNPDELRRRFLLPLEEDDEIPSSQQQASKQNGDVNGSPAAMSSIVK